MCAAPACKCDSEEGGRPRTARFFPETFYISYAARGGTGRNLFSSCPGRVPQPGGANTRLWRDGAAGGRAGGRGLLGQTERVWGTNSEFWSSGYGILSSLA